VREILDTGCERGAWEAFPDLCAQGSDGAPEAQELHDPPPEAGQISGHEGLLAMGRGVEPELSDLPIHRRTVSSIAILFPLFFLFAIRPPSSWDSIIARRRANRLPSCMMFWLTNLGLFGNFTKCKSSEVTFLFLSCADPTLGHLLGLASTFIMREEPHVERALAEEAVADGGGVRWGCVALVAGELFFRDGFVVAELDDGRRHHGEGVAGDIMVGAGTSQTHVGPIVVEFRTGHPVCPTTAGPGHG